MTTNSILDLIGNTPVVELHTVQHESQGSDPGEARGQQPRGIRQRPSSLAHVQGRRGAGSAEAWRSAAGSHQREHGIAMAMIAALRGYRFRAVMAESASIERRKVMKMFGTDIVLTDAAGGTNLAIKTVQQMLAEDPSWVNLNQFENSANPRSHEETTGPEILRDVPGRDARGGGHGDGRHLDRTVCLHASADSTREGGRCRADCRQQDPGPAEHGSLYARHLQLRQSGRDAADD